MADKQKLKAALAELVAGFHEEGHALVDIYFALISKASDVAVAASVITPSAIAPLPSSTEPANTNTTA